MAAVYRHPRWAGQRIIAQPAVHIPGGFAIDGSDPAPVAQVITARLAQT